MTTALLSNADWDGHFWLWPLIPFFWLLVFFVLARFVFWRGRGPWNASAAPDPRAIVAERYARGEITHDEYRERLRHLDER